VTLTPGIACGYWKARKSPFCARSVSLHLDDVLTVEQDLALRDLVGGVAGEGRGERRLAGAVRAHDRVLLARLDREIDARDDLGAVLERGVQVLDLKKWQFRRHPPL